MAAKRFSDAKCRKAMTAVLAEKRESRGISQTELARRAGLPALTMHRLERGQRNMELCTFVRICHALECDPDKLLRQIVARAEENNNNKRRRGPPA